MHLGVYACEMCVYLNLVSNIRLGTLIQEKRKVIIYECPHLKRWLTRFSHWKFHIYKHLNTYWLLIDTALCQIINASVNLKELLWQTGRVIFIFIECSFYGRLIVGNISTSISWKHSHTNVVCFQSKALLHLLVKFNSQTTEN